MTTKRRTTTRRRTPTRKPPTAQQVRSEVFWTVATIALIVATVIFVPMLFAMVR